MEFKKLALATFVAATLAGCGGDDSNDSAPVTNPPPVGEQPVVTTGAFYDAPTNGLYYVTSSGESGYTGEESDGSFAYRKGDSIEFRLGGPKGLLVGQGEATSFVMPQDTAPPINAVNTARLLLSVDTTKDDAEVINIDDRFKSLDAEDAVLLSTIDLGVFNEEKVVSILSDIVGGFTADDIVGQDNAEDHLTNTSKIVTEKRVEEDPLAGSVDLKNKIVRSDLIRSYYMDVNCFLDVSTDDPTAEFEKMVGYEIIEHSVTGPDGESGMNIKISDFFENCAIDKTKAEDVFVSYDEWDMDGDNPIMTSDKLNGFVRDRQYLDVEYNADGSFKQKKENGKPIIINGKPVVDGKVSDRRNTSSYGEVAGAAMSTSTRFAQKDGYASIEDPELGTDMLIERSVWPMEFFNVSYEVSSVDASPRLIDLTGIWNADIWDEECSMYKPSKYEFTSTEVIETFQKISEDCTLEAEEVRNSTFEEYKNMDFWFFAANDNQPKATLMQLNTPVKWDENNDGDSEYVRWAYMPLSADWSDGVLYRYKMRGEGQEIQRTEVITRVK